MNRQQLERRKGRLYDIALEEPSKRNGLINEYKIGSLISSLQESVKCYLNACLEYWFAAWDSREIRLNCTLEEFLNKNKSLLKMLPNITPNGLVLPKVGVMLEYNRIYNDVRHILGNKILIDGVSHVYLPINIRLVDGSGNPAVDSRPRSSTKLHTDIWAGEFTNSVMVHIPLAGNMNSNGIELYEPGESFFPNYVRTFDNFDEGADVVKDATRYDFNMRIGYAYLMDAFLLHRTKKEKPGLRLILSFPMLYKKKVDTDIEILTNRQNDFIPYLDWCQIGRTKAVITNKRMKKFTGEDRVQNMYADSLSLVGLTTTIE